MYTLSKHEILGPILWIRLQKSSLASVYSVNSDGETGGTKGGRLQASG